MPQAKWARFVWLGTGEWLLTTKKKRANGGSVVLARAIWSASLAYLLIVACREVTDASGLVWRFSTSGARQLLLNTAPLFGVIFAAAFTSFYTRFASQWAYMANMYNQIKSAEVRAAGNEEAKKPLALWKAGFIEDAADLHLSTKRGIASTIAAWSSDQMVEDGFVAHCGGKTRFDEIVKAAIRSCGPLDTRAAVSGEDATQPDA